jgi:hypothetical protein
MQLTDLFNFIKRNSRNWNEHQTKKALNEARLIVKHLEKKLGEAI